MLRTTEPYAGNGTFLVGDIRATRAQLERIWGPPQDEGDPPPDGYGPSWTLEDDHGNIVTVYDSHGSSLANVWHVGGHWAGGDHVRAVRAHLEHRVAIEDACPQCHADWRIRCDCELDDLDGNISPRRDSRGLAQRCTACGYDADTSYCHVRGGAHTTDTEKETDHA